MSDLRRRRRGGPGARQLTPCSRRRCWPSWTLPSAPCPGCSSAGNQRGSPAGRARPSQTGSSPLWGGLAGFTRVACCRTAIRRSWMRRISSSPVLRCSFFSRRTQDARSVHCSSVSSEESRGRPASLSGLPDPEAEAGLTQQDLQRVGVQVQSLRLLLDHVHLLRLLVVVGVDAGVGQHLRGRQAGPGYPGRTPRRRRHRDGPTLRARTRALQASMTKVRDFICSASLMEETLFSRLIAKSWRRERRNDRPSLNATRGRGVLPWPGGGRCIWNCNPGTSFPGAQLYSPGRTAGGR